MDRIALALVLVGFVAAASLVLRLRPSPPGPRRVEPDDAGLAGSGVGVVAFSSRHCAACRAWEAALAEAGLAFAKIDVSEHPELARKYGIRATPLVLAIGLPGGEVIASYSGDPSVADVERVRELAGATVSPA